MTTIRDILSELASASTDKRDKGDKFERLMVSYFKTDPLYIERFSNVWLWSDWPGNGGIADTGIDIVCQERNTDGVCAVQCKFFAESHTLQKADIDSFFTASGKYPFTSRIVISTTDRWSVHAEEALDNQQIPATRIRVQDLDESAVDWNKFSLDRPEFAVLKPKKVLRPHQTAALDAVRTGFQTSDRGKMIMACGTGKTFTSLKIAEALVPTNGMVLFCVPSISLMSQTLKEWTVEADRTLRCFAVCSDTKVGKKRENEDMRLHDLAFPATTDAIDLFKQISRPYGGERLTVVFSTYQSIQVIADAQKAGMPEFDLIICDEAHRTTGVTLDPDDESSFVKIHSQATVRGKKRLYMTATPRIYSDDSKAKAKEGDAVLCSMDDPAIYGPEFFKLSFSEAVGKDLLTDYKVMVLAVDEKYVDRAFQHQLADADNEMTLDDAVKIVGCWNGLSKRHLDSGDGPSIVESDPSPMRRAVGFARSIKDSRRIANLFHTIVAEYRSRYDREEAFLECEAEHVDGTFNVLKRNEMLDWLKEEPSDGRNVCRILTNARCLSEGVDVPALDAVIFLNPRDSTVDVVQSVGRVMRKVQGKKYGYVILPIGIPADMKPEDALKDNQKYKVVWQVLQALRAHDDTFNAMVNKIDLNQARDSKLSIIGIGGGPDELDGVGKPSSAQTEMVFPYINEWRDAIYAKIVQKCGDRRYWEDWAKDIAYIAQAHVTRINNLLADADSDASRAFTDFVAGLRENLNPSVSHDDAVEMLAQHLITKPVFDALFENYSFASQNAVSVAMQRMLDQLQEQSLEKETETLSRFYDDVRQRASGIDNQAGKQKIMVELYDKFFRNAFTKMSERLGIVYTPIEVVDFIINSADWACRKEFGYGLTDKGVHILDPFTGTGTFMVRLLQSGLIKDEDLRRKYMHELHANEIVLLAYYIAAINIEETFHYRAGGHYEPFSGIVLTDTFQMAENATELDTVFPENNRRAAHQRSKEIRIIIGNPPYSAGQTSANDANQNQDYPKLNSRIRSTYAEYSTGTNKNSLYDSYIQAFRWASDRIGKQGIVCYVSNGAFIDGNAADGFRKSLADEFSAIYCFNLRGNQRTSGELSRQEGGKIFGSGSRAPIAITLLVKNPEHAGPCEIHYHDIGDYLSREEKLSIISSFGGMENVPCVRLKPNDSHDWINLRDPAFASFMPIEHSAAGNVSGIFVLNSRGLETARDAWVYNFSKASLKKNIARMTENFNIMQKSYLDICNSGRSESRELAEPFIDYDERKFKWSRQLIRRFVRRVALRFDPSGVRPGMYRPFCTEWTYFDSALNDYPGKMPTFFPTVFADNLLISLMGLGALKDFSCLMTKVVPDVNLISPTLCFPLHIYEPSDAGQPDLLADDSVPGYTRKEAITDAALMKFREKYGKAVTKEDIFYYVYGILHSPEYKQRFASDLKKMLPRIPFASDFWAFSEAGRELATWHLEYEKVEPYPVTETAEPSPLPPKEYYRVVKMTFGKNGKNEDRTVIQYNAHIKLSGIPLEAYDYIVNGKSALDWIMERYQVTTDRDSCIVNDPNDWSEDPRYIVDLVKRIVRVSLETVRIVNALPALGDQL